tara:strand:- start:101 stop:1267 length:1167 start_codon:yes stop_codon:yes gene_type:complete
MPQTKLNLFAQLLEHIDRSVFKKLVIKHSSDKYSKGISTWTHFVSMLFMQFAHIDSLRDIQNGLRSLSLEKNHLNIGRAPCKSSLSYLNKKRDAAFFEDLYFNLLEKLEPSLRKRRIYARKLKRKVYLMDASVITLSLSLFDWAKYRTTKGALKLHAVLDYDSGLPSYVHLSDGKTSDITQAKTLDYTSGSVVVMDRAYVDFEWLFNLDSKGVLFVTRLKSNLLYEPIQEYHLDPRQPHIDMDQDIVLKGGTASKHYPKKLRLVHVWDEKNQSYLKVITNNLSWTADTVSQLYKARWDVEVFFKHLKQLFRVKSFVGTSENAVRIQMWCSLIGMLLLRYLKSKAKYPWHLSNLITFLRLNLYTKISLEKWIHQPFEINPQPPPELRLF